MESPTIRDLAERLDIIYIHITAPHNGRGKFPVPPRADISWWSTAGFHSCTATPAGVTISDGWMTRTSLDEEPAGTTFAAVDAFMNGTYRRSDIKREELPEPVLRAMITAMLNKRPMPGTPITWATDPGIAAVI